MMKLLTAAIFALSLVGTNAELERSYTDDMGVTHTTTIDKPTIVTFAHSAVSLFDYGLGTDQLIGTYGEYVVTGSDFDFDAPEQSSSYSADPSPEDIAMLLQTTNLSPECERVPGYCTAVNVDTLVDLDPDYLIVHGYAESPWAFSNFTEVELAFPKTKIIFNDISMKGDGCTTSENCYGKSMIDVIEQYHELAVFLNVEETSKMKEDMATLCAVATEFSGHMQTVHDKGIRTMAAYVDPSSAFYASPINDMVLRMFEELGMPILHIGACQDCSMSYFWETIPTESYFASCSAEQINSTDLASCNDNPLYPVDVWLYDHRTRAQINNPDFSVVFPDKAIMEKQFVEWPIGGRKITPAHAIEILQSVGPSIAGFNRLHDETVCVPDLDVSSESHRQSGEGVKGAGAGEYACYDTQYHNTKYFQGCSSEEEAATTTDNPGACYDMVSHQCGCGPTRCNSDLCTADGGAWTDGCPQHCTECDGAVAVGSSSHDEGEGMSHSSHDEGEEMSHSSHDEGEEMSHSHDSHSHDESDEESSANGRSVLDGVVMTILFAVFAW